MTCQPPSGTAEAQAAPRVQQLARHWDETDASTYVASDWKPQKIEVKGFAPWNEKDVYGR